MHAYKPDEAAVEQTFVNKDAVATLKLGQARGVVMLVPARAGLAVAEYAPNAVKKAVIGVGHGEKTADPDMVRVLMPQAKFKSNDAADALAIAICHAHNRGGGAPAASQAERWAWLVLCNDISYRNQGSKPMRVTAKGQVTFRATCVRPGSSPTARSVRSSPASSC